MKLSILSLGILMCIGAAFADDATVAQNVIARKTCAEIATEIENLSAIENPSATILETLNHLQVQQRSNCVAKSGGRRVTERNVASLGVEPQKTDITIDALSEYLANKKSNCEKLNSEIEKLTTDNENADVLAAMQGVYDMDCVEQKSVQNIPEMTQEEWAAIYDANLAAGLCGDGTKPNRLGCCTDEVFKDLGNSLFACCPRTGGDCFPPIK